MLHEINEINTARWFPCFSYGENFLVFMYILLDVSGSLSLQIPCSSFHTSFLPNVIFDTRFSEAQKKYIYVSACAITMFFCWFFSNWSIRLLNLLHLKKITCILNRININSVHLPKTVLIRSFKSNSNASYLLQKLICETRDIYIYIYRRLI